MTSTPTAPAGSAAAAAPAKPVRRKRGEGQWALGYSEPLNKNEQTKKDDNPLNVRARIENIYSKRGFDSIDPADLRGRFRWMGLYTQRAPGFDGGKTAMLEEEELDDRYFMMRVRTDGQLLGVEQLRALGETSTTYARDTADITDRKNIQYHWIEVERRPRDLGAPRVGRPHHRRGVRRLAAALPRLPGRRRRQGRDHRRLLGAGRDQAPLHRQPGVLQPAAQVQDRPDRTPEPRRRARGQRRLLRRHRPPRARPRLRPLGRRRPLHQPDARPEARRLDPARRGRRRLGGRRVDLPRLRLPPAALQGAPEVPGRRLGQGEVPRGARDRVPRA